MPTTTNMAAANAARQEAGSARLIAVLTDYFAAGDTAGAPECWLTTGRARLRHPHDSLAELGARLDVNKDVVAGRLRRLERLIFRRYAASGAH